MASLNKVMLIGNLGKDPELRYTASGQAVASFSLATSEKFKDKTSGEWQERTEWHKVTMWGKLGELAGEFLAKGKTVFIEGRLQTRKYEKDGVTHYSTEIVGDKMEFLSGKGEKAAAGDSSAPPKTGGGNYEEPPIPDDDIPF